VVVPAWILMRVGAQLIVDKEYPKNEPGWVDVGFLVSEPGAVLLLVLGILAWLSLRRNGIGRLALAVPVLASVYLVALGVAWFAMSAKPGA
jgi:asparagine N-glycosylation enzyme membrane subunit Stt3